jgi:hypothetical protein
MQRKSPETRRDKPTMTGLKLRCAATPGEIPAARQNNQQIEMVRVWLRF